MEASLPSGVSWNELAPDYPSLEIEIPSCSAKLALHGAHLIHWQPSHATSPVLYTSPTAVYRGGKAIRGGLPICWPWFNAHPTDPATHPSHGVARKLFWKLETVEMKGDDLHLTFTLPTSETVEAHVPFAHEVHLRMILGQTCHIALETKNLSEQNISVGGALHSYLAVSDIANISLKGLQNTPYLDTTTSPAGRCTQTEADFRVTGEVDSIYTGFAHEVLLHDEELNSIITVAKTNSLTTVVWNPCSEKATALDDLPNEAYRDFICVEAANAHHDARIVPPNASHILTTTLSVS